MLWFSDLVLYRGSRFVTWIVMDRKSQFTAIKMKDIVDCKFLSHVNTFRTMPVSSVRDQCIYIDSDLSMQTHVSQTVLACFALLRQIQSIRRSVTRPVLQSLVAALTMTHLDYGCSTIAGLPARQLNRLQLVLNAAAWLVYSTRRTEHVSPLLRELHWLRVPQRIEFH